MEGADLDPLGVNGGHGGFEVAELLPLLAVKPALTTGLWWRFVVAAVLIRHGAESGEGGGNYQGKWKTTHLGEASGLGS